MTPVKRSVSDLNVHCTSTMAEEPNTTEQILQRHEVPAWQHVSSRQLLDHPYAKLVEEEVSLRHAYTKY